MLLFSRKRSIQANFKVVKDPETPETDPLVSVQIAAAYADIVKDVVTHAALTIGGVFCICKIVGRICK